MSEREIKIGMNFEGFAEALDLLTEEEKQELDLEEDQGLTNRLTNQQYLRSQSGDYIEINNRSGIHSAIKNIGFSHKIDDPYKNILRRHH